MYTFKLPFLFYICRGSFFNFVISTHTNKLTKYPRIPTHTTVSSWYIPFTAPSWQYHVNLNSLCCKVSW